MTGITIFHHYKEPRETHVKKNAYRVGQFQSWDQRLDRADLFLAEEHKGVIVLNLGT